VIPRSERPDKRDQVTGFFRRHFGFDPRQGFLQLETGAVKQPVCFLERRNLLRREARPPEADHVEALRFRVQAAVKEKGRTIAVHAHAAGDHRQPPDLRELVNLDPARNESLVLDLDVTGQ